MCIFMRAACETELRQLRKATSDYEAQNAVLQRHVDSLYAAVNRLESETNQQRTTNQTLQRHLDSLRSQLAGSFAAVPLPGSIHIYHLHFLYLQSLLTVRHV